MTNQPMLRVEGLGKTFILHQQGGLALEVIRELSFDLYAGEVLALAGPSGLGKSSILKMITGNYLCSAGRILVRDPETGEEIDVARAAPRRVLALRRRVLGHVSQFLRVIPRVTTLDIVAEPLAAFDLEPEEAKSRAADILARLNLPKNLWSLPPATFSGGEKQRVNIARGLVAPYPILLLDEPTASLDAANQALVEDLIAEKRRQGVAVLGIFHDAAQRARIATREIDLSAYAAKPLERIGGVIPAGPNWGAQHA